jgi:hypothetical protein
MVDLVTDSVTFTLSNQHSPEDIEGLRRTLARRIVVLQLGDPNIQRGERHRDSPNPAPPAPGIGPLAMARWRRALLASTSAFALAAGWAMLDARPAR